jgi:ribosome-binding protein aMBF1 (putative translation factor)
MAPPLSVTPATSANISRQTGRKSTRFTAHLNDILVIRHHLVKNAIFHPWKGSQMQEPTSSPDPKEAARSLALALGRRVSDLRLRRGWSQKELGARPGVSYGNVRAIEGGADHFPRLDTLVALAVALGVNSLDELFGAPTTTVSKEIEKQWSQEASGTELAKPA